MTLRPFELEGWRVEPDRGALIPAGGGPEVRLEPRQMDLLLVFAGSGGRVIGKDELVAQVWGGRTVGDDTLAAAVSRLRSALGETRAHRFIETVPKRGYRWALDPAAPAPPSTPAEVQPLIEQGRAALKVPLAPSLAQARLYFEAAIAEDPASAAAQAGLAETLLLQQFMGEGSGLAPVAKAAAHAATGLDPALAEAWTALGLATLIADRDFVAADRALLRATSLAGATAATHRARAFALLTVGRFVEAEREARAAIEAEPLNLQVRGLLLQVLILSRRYRPAIAEARKALELAPASAEAWSAKGWAHLFLGEGTDAVEAFVQSLNAWNVGPDALCDIHAREGIEAMFAATADLFEAQTLLFKPRSLDVAMLRAGAGQTDQAFAALDRALALDDPYLLALPYLPHLDRLRNDHRFGRLLERVRPVR
jgi:DNA-binding winged helix-turn-helix (wHTH) protein